MLVNKACIVISVPNFELVYSQVQCYELCEIRLDLCLFTDKQIINLFSSHKNLIATYHENKLPLETRISALKLAIQSGAAYVDIDYFLEPKIIEELIDFARKNECKSIISYHNFSETPDYEILEAIVILTEHYNSDLAKLATRYNDKSDAEKIVDLYKHSQDLIAFCMGEDAKYTRFESINLGAPFCYVYDGNIKNKLAEGMPSLAEFNEEMKNHGYYDS